MPDARIALIEAGSDRLGLTTKIPGTGFIASASARRNWNYETEPVPALNGRKLWWFQGRILGGSSSINGMLCLRGHSLEYDQWAQRGWRLGDLFPERHGFTVMVGAGRPLSRGHVLLRGSDPTAHPRIFPEYFSGPEDLRALARSVRRIREMMRGPTIRDLIAAELVPCPIANEQAAIEEDIRARAATFFHRAGPAGWAAIRPRSSIRGYGSRALRDCASPMLRSCRPHSMPAPTHQPS
jgi:choline dehydrogenase-like flavoprotein